MIQQNLLRNGVYPSGVVPHNRSEMIDRFIKARLPDASFAKFYELLNFSEALISKGAANPKSMAELDALTDAHDSRIIKLADGRRMFHQAHTGRGGGAGRIMTPYDRPIDEKVDYGKFAKTMQLFNFKPDAYAVVDLIGGEGTPLETKTRFVGPKSLLANILMVAKTLKVADTPEQMAREPDFIILSNPTDTDGGIRILTEDRIVNLENQTYTGYFKKSNFMLSWDAAYFLEYLPLHAAQGIIEENNQLFGAVVLGPSGCGKSTIAFNLFKILMGDDRADYSESSGGAYAWERGGSFAKTGGPEMRELGDPRVVMESVAWKIINKNGVDLLVPDTMDETFCTNGRAAIPWDAFKNYDPRAWAELNVIITINRNHFDPPVMVMYDGRRSASKYRNPLNGALAYAWIESLKGTGATTTLKGMDAGSTTDFRPDVGGQDLPKLLDLLGSTKGQKLLVLAVNTGNVGPTDIKVKYTLSAIRVALGGEGITPHPLLPGVGYVQQVPDVDYKVHNLDPFGVNPVKTAASVKEKLGRAVRYQEEVLKSPQDAELLKHTKKLFDETSAPKVFNIPLELGKTLEISDQGMVVVAKLPKIESTVGWPDKLDEQLLPLVGHGLIVDFSLNPEIRSPGIGRLVGYATQAKKDGKFFGLVGVNNRVSQAIGIASLEKILVCYSDLDTAFAAAKDFTSSAPTP
ncbi:Phosphoenolpyruvate carboxykinase [Candidatus Gugararchaeum adminiculabundum]|nr:Phosphoenolpyruvate carboxykinase [Candidatus Gugararchaeum adminiculabundum]